MHYHKLLPLFTVLALLGCGSDSDPLSDHGKVLISEVKKNPSTVVNNTQGAQSKAAASSVTLADEAEEIEWEELIPPHWRADPKLVELYRKGEIGDDDPRVIETRMRLAEPMAPANPAFDGKRVKLAGFVVPLEVGKKKVTEFLLVPYHGACVHVPPPPTNQTILVKTAAEGVSLRGLFDTVWVVGNLKVEQNESDLAISGYTLQAEHVESYDEPGAEVIPPHEGG